MSTPSETKGENKTPEFLYSPGTTTGMRKEDLFPHQIIPGPVFYTAAEQSSTQASSLDADVTRGVKPADSVAVEPAPRPVGPVGPGAASLDAAAVWTGLQAVSVSGSSSAVGGGAAVVLSGKSGVSDKLSLSDTSFRPESFAQLSLRGKPAELPAYPAFVEKHSSFVSTREPRELLQSVMSVFEQSKVDFDFVPQKHKLTGVCYDPSTNSACTFKVRVFAHRSDKSRCVVEFQRRSGCVVAFGNFYRNTLRALPTGSVACSLLDDTALFPAGSASPLVLSAGASAAAAAAPATPAAVLRPLGSVMPLPMPAVSMSTASSMVTLDDSTIACLLDMASAKDTDIQREAARALANASSASINQLKLVSLGTASRVAPAAASTAAPAAAAASSPAGAVPSGKRLTKETVVNAIAGLLLSKDRDVARCAAMLLFHVAQQPSIRPLLLSVLPTMLSVLDAPTMTASSGVASALIAKETKRLIAKTLVTLCGTHAKEVVSVLRDLSLIDRAGKITGVMTRFKEVEDVSLRESVNAALALLQKA